AYISPISRKAMMRVSRNNIWANLQQMEIGVEGKIANALLSSLKEPSSFLFGLLEDPTDAEQDASDYNKRQLERIEDSIQSTQSVITEKMDDLWELYNDKVKPFENTDDSYKELASDVKDDYTGFFEGLGEDLMDSIKDSFDLLRGFVSGAVDLVKGVAILASDAGIVLVSSQIPDPIEPAFLKDKNDEIVEDYINATKQLNDYPLIVAEMFVQSVSDTVEEEGAMFATGEVLTGFIPVAGGLKYAKEGAVLKNVGKTKGGDKKTGNTSDNVNNIKEIYEVNYGDQFTKGKKGRKELTSNVRYVTQDGYKYTTDELGRIVDVEAEKLILKKADRNLGMQRVAGREDRLPDDDGGHLIGSQFHGSGDIDNLVAQNSQINRSGGEWYKMETVWASALKEEPPKKVSVEIEPVYNGDSLRPSSFEVFYKV